MSDVEDLVSGNRDTIVKLYLTNFAKMFKFVPHVLVVAALAMPMSMAPRTAYAFDAWGLLVDVMNEANNVGVFPISGTALNDSRTLFECIDAANEDAVAVGNCVKGQENTELGKAITSGATWVWDAVDIYIAVVSKDFWGIVENVGVVAACAAASVLAGGLDVCGLLGELIALAEDFVGAIVDVAAFLEGVLTDIVNAFDAWGSGSQDPKDYYRQHWEIHHAAGVYYTLKEPTKYYELTSDVWEPCNDYYSGYLSESHGHEVCNPMRDTAFRNTTSDIATRLQDFVKSYSRATRGMVSSYVYNWLSGEWYAPNTGHSQTDPKYGLNPAVDQCRTELRTQLLHAFAQSDKDSRIRDWIDILTKLQCSAAIDIHWELATAKWNRAKSEHSALIEQGCTQFKPGSPSLFCKSYETLSRCVDLFHDLGRSEPAGSDCTTDTRQADQAAAILIASRMGRDAKGKVSCEVDTYSRTPAILCHRDKRKARCELEVAQIKKTYALSQLKCNLRYYPDYDAKVKAVASTVSNYNQGKTARVRTPGNISAAVADRDMHIGTSNQSGHMSIAKDDPLKVNLSLAPNTRLEDTLRGKTAAAFFAKYSPDCTDREVDGIEQPSICNNLNLAQAVSLANKLVTPKDTRVAVTGKNADKITGSVAPRFKSTKGAITNTKKNTTKLRSQGIKIAPSQSANKKPQVANKPTFHSMDDLLASKPQGRSEQREMKIKQPAGGSASQKTPESAKPIAGTLKLAKAVSKNIDLMAEKKIRLNNISRNWDDNISMDAAALTRKHAGSCELDVRYKIHNSGQSATGLFSRRWINRNGEEDKQLSTNSVAANGAVMLHDRINLKPGLNRLILIIDSGNSVKETNEKNNRFSINIKLTGSCEVVDHIKKSPATSIKGTTTHKFDLGR